MRLVINRCPTPTDTEIDGKYRDELSEKIEGLLAVLNDMIFMTRSIQNMNPETAKHFENTISALLTKVSKKLQYGTVNVF